jgi:hypothetical protein
MSTFVISLFIAVPVRASKPKPEDFPLRFSVLTSSVVSGQGCYMTLDDGNGRTYHVSGLGMFHCTAFHTGEVLPGRTHKFGARFTIFLLSLDAKGNPKEFEFLVTQTDQ